MKLNYFNIWKGIISIEFIIHVIKKDIYNNNNNKSQQQHKINNQQVFECLTNIVLGNTTTNQY